MTRRPTHRFLLRNHGDQRAFLYFLRIWCQHSLSQLGEALPPARPKCARQSLCLIQERLREGVPVSRVFSGILPLWIGALLEAGEKCGEPEIAIHRALEAHTLSLPAPSPDLSRATRSLILGSSSFVLLGIFLFTFLPVLATVAHGLGSPVAEGSRGWVEWLASQRSIVVSACILLASAPLFLPLSESLQNRSSLVSSAVLRIPVLGSLVRLRSLATFHRILALHLRVETPLSEAWHSACDGVAYPALSKRLQLEADAVLDGEEVPAILARLRAPARLAHEWSIGITVDDNGHTAASRVADVALQMAKSRQFTMGRVLIALGFAMTALAAAAAGACLALLYSYLNTF